jgi:cell division inhibitor SepF
VNLELAERDLVRRMIDFCSGLTYGLGGTIEKVADQVFLLSPVDMRISKEDKERIQRQRLYR